MLHCVNDKNAIHANPRQPPAHDFFRCAITIISNRQRCAIYCCATLWANWSILCGSKSKWDCYSIPLNHENVNGSRNADADAHLFTFICMMMTSMCFSIYNASIKYTRYSVHRIFAQIDCKVRVYGGMDRMKRDWNATWKAARAKAGEKIHIYIYFAR